MNTRSFASFSLQWFLHTFILLMLLLSPLQSVAAYSFQPAPPTPAEPSVPESTGLYRTTVAVRGPADWRRLEKLGVVVLEKGREEERGKGKKEIRKQGGEGSSPQRPSSLAPMHPGTPAQTIVVLADEDQLEALARLRFEPRGTDEVGALVMEHAAEKPWLVAGVRSLLERVAEERAADQQKDADQEDAQSATFRSSAALTPELKAALATLTSVDDDADGLTNTQEAWWCTDPMNPDTDSDGKRDGAEIQVLKDWVANRRSSPPNETPWPDWPPQRAGCDDKDHDSIPNLAERWELGLNMDLESSDRDKFDDGQELFGVTYCPGGDLNCNYGDLPRSSDSGYVGATMPAWVKTPGNHPMVAAFPVPEVDVVESSLHVETVTTVTTDHTIGSGTEKSYSTAKTEGTSTSVANTETWSDWQEVSVSRTTPAYLSTARSNALANWFSNLFKGEAEFDATAQMQGQAGGAASGCGLSLACAAGSISNQIQAQIGKLELEGSLIKVKDAAVDVQTTLGDFRNSFNGWLQNANILSNNCIGNCGDTIVDPSPAEQNHLDKSAETQDKILTPSDINVVVNPQNEVERVVYHKSYPVTYFRGPPQSLSQITRGETTGHSVGGARTTTSEQYEEHTVTNGEAFSNEESWGTATAVDSAHAADLWFTYEVRNTGTEYAREISDIAFNIYIGDDPNNPAHTYFVAADVGGDGKFHNFMPDEEHTYTSARIPLTLEQMKAIDLGGPVRIVVEDFTYGADEFFYENAANAGVQVAIEDGTDDGDENIDTYLIPTWGQETVLDVLARYFPHTTDADGNLIAIWTPEYRSDTPAWCNAPQVTGAGPNRTLWCKHALSTADWWNVYTNGLGGGDQGFQDTPATPGSVALFRFNKDTDLDGYSDRSERRLGTDENDPADHPRPELIAGLHSNRDGDQVTATLSLLNTGLYDAYGVEAVMIAPDDSVSITNNTVGGSGRVRAQKQVIVGSRILMQSPLPDPWTQDEHAHPAAAGYYTGQQDRTYTFTVSGCGDSLGCDVGSGSWNLDWSDGAGNSGTLNFGAGYASPTFLNVGSLGVKLALYSGKVYDGEAFTVEARTPRDTFQYTINREPYTEPVVIVSYNDPQGNHRFVTPVNLNQPTEDLVPHSGKMLHGDAGIDIVTQEPFTPDQAMATTLVAQAPATTRMQDAHLFLEFIDPEGTVVREEATTVTLEPGPNIITVPWNSADFNPAYDLNQDYIVLAFFTDWQGNILDTAGRPLSSFQADPKPAFALDEAGTTWDFGTVPQGTRLEHTFTLANTGMLDLKATVVGTGVRTDQNVPGQPAWTDTGLDVEAGDAIGIRADGEVCYGSSGTTACHGPDGKDENAPDGWTLPGEPKMSLIAKIGDGTPFYVGSTYVDTAGSSGRLYLGTNDCSGCYGDNGGSYQAHIEIQGVPTSFQDRPSFSVGPAGATSLDVTLDTHYLPTGSFDRTLTVRTSDPAHPTQAFRIQGTVESYVTPAQALDVSPYRPWDQRVAVSGDRSHRAVVTFNDTIAANAADVHPLRVYNDTRQTALGAGREVARAVASGGMPVSSNDEARSAAGEQIHGPSAVTVEEVRSSEDASLLSSPPWWNESYQRRRQVTVTARDAVPNPYVGVGTFNLRTLTGVRADLKDVRIVYWNGSSWTELDRQIFSDNWWIFPINVTIPAGESNNNFWIYYDNPVAGNPPSNVENIYVPRYSSGVISKYRFDEGTGAPNDTGPDNNDLNTRANGTYVRGKFGYAYQGDGNSQYALKGAGDINKWNNLWVVEFWATKTKRGAAGGNENVAIAKWGDWGNIDSFFIGFWDDGKIWIMTDNSHSYQYDVGLPPTWSTPHHIAVVFRRDVGGLRIYVDNVLKKNISSGIYMPRNSQAWTSLLAKGTGGWGGHNDHWGGTIEQVVLSNGYRGSFPHGSVLNDPTVSVGPEAPLTGIISGRVFEDLNSNGTQDTGEPGISEVTVNLDGTGQSRTTDSNGDYSFTDVNPGNYTVSVVVPAGYTNTTPTSRNVSLNSGGSVTANFGLSPRASIAGKVFHDTNNNGEQDGGESGVAGVTITLDGTGKTRTTAGDGSYSFADLLPDSYSVSVSVPDGYVNTTSTTVSCNLQPGSTCTANFGILQYTIEKVAGTDHQNRFFMPEDFRGGRRYWVQYGRKLAFSAAGEHVAQVKLPQASYSSATLDVLLADAGASFVQINLDVGNDGTWEWGHNDNVTPPVELTTNDFAAALSAFMANATPDADGLVTVPLRVSLNTSGWLYLTNLIATPDGVSDVSIAPEDVTLSPTDPVEGDTVDVQATLHNASGYDTGGLVVSFFATPPAGFGETYIGAAFVPNVPANGGTVDATIQWNTLGFAGDVPVRVTVDPSDYVAETDEENNEVTANLTVLTRPDLQVPAINLSDPEPVAGQPVSVTLTISNAGQTAAGASTLALYDGNPDSGGVLIDEGSPAVAGESETQVDFTWTPATPGSHRLFVISDRDDAVGEFDEGNNQIWIDVYVGFAGPLLLDSGGDPDPAYTSEQGYGHLDGQPNNFCGTEPAQTLRSDADGEVQYRFDHLLPGHFYHLDVSLFECDGLGRQESILVDGLAITDGPENLADGEVHELSLLLDPALYANRTITVGVRETQGYDTVVAKVELHDVDYRFADAGAEGEPPYTPERGYGWLDGQDQQAWGTLPYQTRRIDLLNSDPSDDPDNDLRYQFDGLDPAKRYQLHLTFYQKVGGLVQQGIFVGTVDTGATVELDGEQRVDKTVDVPVGTYAGGSIVVHIRRTDGAAAGAFVNEIALEELTSGDVIPPSQRIDLHSGWNWVSFALEPRIERDTACTGVTPTSAFSSFTGEVLIDGQPAPVGTLVEAYSPRGDKVGCQAVSTAGTYPFLRVYGEEGATPGMQSGEPIIFKVNGVPATVTSGSVTWQNDKDTHPVDLAASGLPPVEKVLAGVSDVFEKLLCEVGTYLPLPANPIFNSCHTMQAGEGYLLRASGVATLTIEGDRVPADTPLDLEQGWNWIGYLPACALPVETALSSIDGQFDLLHGETGTFQPPADNPSNTLTQMGPGRGYMIRMTEAATLKYPAGACGGAATQTFRVSETLKVSSSTCEATPTPFFTVFHGTATLGDVPYPAGTPIEALNPRGEVVGCGEVGADGAYPFMRVYGADDGIAGMQAGEPIAFRVNGRLVQLDGPPLWKNDRDVHRLDLRVEPERMLLPVVAR